MDQQNTNVPKNIDAEFEPPVVETSVEFETSVEETSIEIQVSSNNTSKNENVFKTINGITFYNKIV